MMDLQSLLSAQLGSGGYGSTPSQPFFGNNKNMLAEQLSAGGYGSLGDMLTMLTQSSSPMQYTPPTGSTGNSSNPPPAGAANATHPLLSGDKATRMQWILGQANKGFRQ
jgi:hypothetical protein